MPAVLMAARVPREVLTSGDPPHRAGELFVRQEEALGVARVIIRPEVTIEIKDKQKILTLNL